MTTSRIVRIAFIVIIIAALYLLATNPAETASAPTFATECDEWAYNEGEDNVPDSPVMHTIGCDTDETVGSDYVREEGRCAAIARDAYRSKGFHADSDALQYYMELRGCETLEDGSYGPLPIW